MKTPNLFSFATSELSQDAFICWLLSWANKDCLAQDSELHKCSISFIEAIFKKYSISPPKAINKIKVTKQDKNIDVLCIINDEYAILIEDKVFTKNHSDQLQRYYSEVASRGFSADKILPIYYKTEDQSSYWAVTENGYQVLLREDIVAVLHSYSGENQILVDYKKYLEDISNKVESYKTLPINDWHWHSWIGFFQELQVRLSDGAWDYVANPRGGFLGFWWHWLGNEECGQHLQLEWKQLCFKISVKDKSKYNHFRSKWHQKLIKEGQGHSSLQLAKPARFGSGNYMTVCIHNEDYRVTGKGNIIDMSETVRVLQSAQDLLKSAVI